MNLENLKTTTNGLVKGLWYFIVASINILIIVAIVLWSYHKFGLIWPTIFLIVPYLYITIRQRLMFHEIVLPVILLLAVVNWGGVLVGLSGRYCFICSYWSNCSPNYHL